MSASVQEQIIAFSKTAQSAIDVASTDVIRINTISADPADVEPMVEDDADEIGKGHEFAEESFLTSWKTSKKLNVYNSVQAFTWAAAFGLGGADGGGTFSPIDPITNTHEIELPWATFYEAVRPGSNAIYDRALLGMCVEKWTMKLENGPGRKNSTLEIDLTGTGKYNDDAGLSYPSKTPVNLLPAASLILNVNGIDYVTSRNFESLEMSWDNNIRKDSGYFPGSGFLIDGDATSGSVCGRMEFGKRQFMLTTVVRFIKGSQELAMLRSQEAGTTTLSLSGGGGLGVSMQVSQTRIKTAKIADANGIITLRCEISCQVAPGGSAADLLKVTVPSQFGSWGRAA